MYEAPEALNAVNESVCARNQFAESVTRAYRHVSFGSDVTFTSTFASPVSMTAMLLTEERDT